MIRAKYKHTFYSMYPHVDTAEDKLTKRQYYSFMRDVMLEFKKYILDGYDLVLPYKLGTITIIGYYIPPKITEDGKVIGAVNYYETVQLRKKLNPEWEHEDWKKLPYEQRPKVYYDNSHTEDVVYKIKWCKRRAKNFRMYSFKPNAKLQQELGQILKREGNQRYKIHERCKTVNT